MKKRCNGCQRSLPRSEFWRDGSRADGLSKRCRDCVNARKRKYGAPKAPDGRPLTPLESAHARHQTQSASAKLQGELAALVRENKQLRATLGAVEKLGAGPTILSYKKPKHLREDAVACCLASDWHVEEPVEPESVNGLNAYSLDIARERARHFFTNSLALTDMMARDSHIGTLFLGALGDFFTNYLHEENREVNELPPEEAARFAQELLASGIAFWLKESRYRLIVDCVAGNHGRMTEKRRAANHPGTSLETFMYHSLAATFRDNPRVEFRVAKSKMLYRTFFERFVLREIHGDDIGYQGGIGGVTIPIRKKLAGWDKGIRASLTVMGHFHQLLDGGDHIVNGSAIGFSPYSQSLGASPEEARQAFFLVSARNGGEKSVTAPIWLDAKHKAAASG
jgi:hypothetical protein